MTGTLNVPTMMKMNKPRCGCPDNRAVMSLRRKRFTLSEFRWMKEILTYHIMEYPQYNQNYPWQNETFTARRIDKEVRLAFACSKLNTGKVNFQNQTIYYLLQIFGF